ncbi:hypothetical protein AVEN_250519-1 [Araneus ventricosus]|uniref:Uncharacterized protein n=1 Tax=Araneus ventricosus TaxID=182803 RepID=A0A4Y2RSY0_ARAVE|nr:hypothetical protein AVEN_250519-1 [Araneus ventricosus]
MSQRSDLLKRRRNRVAAQRQISEEETKERAKRYYEKNKQKKNFIKLFPNKERSLYIRSKPGNLYIDSVLYIARIRNILYIASVRYTCNVYNYPSTLGNSFMDLTFTRNITPELLNYVCHFSYHRPILHKIVTN